MYCTWLMSFKNPCHPHLCFVHIQELSYRIPQSILFEAFQMKEITVKLHVHVLIKVKPKITLFSFLKCAAYLAALHRPSPFFP